MKGIASCPDEGDYKSYKRAPPGFYREIFHCDSHFFLSNLFFLTTTSFPFFLSFFVRTSFFSVSLLRLLRLSFHRHHQQHLPNLPHNLFISNSNITSEHFPFTFHRHNGDRLQIFAHQPSAISSSMPLCFLFLPRQLINPLFQPPPVSMGKSVRNFTSYACLGLLFHSKTA